VLTKTEAITLKSMKYGDTSKIVTFYTKEFGKIKGIAKGARTSKNKFGSSLEPLTKALLVFYKKEHRELHLISQCDAIDSFRHISEDLDRMSVGLAVLELVDQVTHDEERKPALYDLLAEILGVLNCSTGNFSVYFDSFRLKLVVMFGYAPDFEKCGMCSEPLNISSGENRFEFQVARGAVLCSRCSENRAARSRGFDRTSATVSLSAGGLRAARRLVRAAGAELAGMEYDARTGNEVDAILRLYMRYHFEGLKPLNSTTMFTHH
jgi:DNA repair protein RecO (recombination protein O)